MTFTKRQINPDASQKRLVAVGRISTVIFDGIEYFTSTTASECDAALLIFFWFGAGTGLIFILRWFWWRINAWSEIVAMVASGFYFFAFSYSRFRVKEALFGLEGVLPAWAEFPFVVFCDNLPLASHHLTDTR